jgi:GntR family transcriptional regulator
LVSSLRLIGRNTGVARYHQLYTALSDAMTNGALAPGDALPSEPKLAVRHGISRTTVRRALARLEKEGRVERKRGSGTYVRGQPRLPLFRVRAERFLHDVRALDTTTTSKLLQFDRVDTPPFVGEVMPDFGPRAVVIRRTRSIDDVPFVIATSHVPEEVGRRLTPRRLGNEVVLLALQRLGVRPASGEQVMTAVAADGFAAKALKVPMGSPLLRVRRIVRDKKGRPVEHQEYLYRPERYEHRVRFDMDGKSAARKR